MGSGTKTDVRPGGQPASVRPKSAPLSDFVPAETTNPGAPAPPAPKPGPRDVIAELTGVLVASHPHLVEAVMWLEREMRAKAIGDAKNELVLQREQLATLTTNLNHLFEAQRAAAEAQTTELRQLAQAQLAAVQKVAAAELGKVAQVLGAELEAVRAAETSHSATIAQISEALAAAEAQRTEGVRDYLRLVGEQGEKVRKIIGEHLRTIERLQQANDKYERELTDLRSQYSDDLKSQAKHLAQLSERHNRVISEAAEQRAAAEAEIRTLRESLAQAQDDLASAIAARDRLNERMLTVEKNIEGVLVPLRAEVEESRGRIRTLEHELRLAQEALPILMPPKDLRR